MSIQEEILESYCHSDVPWGAELEFANTRSIKQYTHRIYNRYPARSVNLVPQAILSDLAVSHATEPLKVLDPFMGSGTTALETVLIGGIPYGIEIDPFARFISDMKIHNYEQEDWAEIQNFYERITANWCDYQVDKELIPELRNIRYWFSDETFNQLLQLKNAIYTICFDSSIAKDFFRIVFADIIRPCSKAERQSHKPYISKKYPKIPADVHESWQKSYAECRNAVSEFLAEIDSSVSKIQWVGENATQFDLEDKIDVAITSPPYINSIEYVRSIKIESAWIDCGTNKTLSNVRKEQLGEKSRSLEETSDYIKDLLKEYVSALERVDKSRMEIMLAYFHGMHRNLHSVHEVIRPGAEYHLIIGNSEIRGLEIPTYELLAKMGIDLGFEWVSYYKYKLKDHRTSIPRNGQGGKINFEHVVSLRKV